MRDAEQDRQARAASSESSFDEGRYLYCVVAVDDDPEQALRSGVDGEQPRLVVADGLGAVVQSCESQYDSDRPETVKQWLLEHQAVVDDAGQAFGTPLPFRFDTVLKGGDERTRRWLTEESASLEAALDDLAGHWEYRVDLVWDADGLADVADDDLEDLRERADDATGGEAFLREKQYERRRSNRMAGRRAEVVDAVEDRLEDLASAVQSVDRSAGASIVTDRSSPDDERDGLALLASPKQEEAIGELLDEVASNQALEVRFTGPWPPYSFAPTIGERA